VSEIQECIDAIRTAAEYQAWLHLLEMRAAGLRPNARAFVVIVEARTLAGADAPDLPGVEADA
jgi:hypothetical protein